MQLTRFTDLGLRVLMYLCDPPASGMCTIGEIAERFEVAHNHLTKVVQFMGQQGWLHTIRGKGGGIELAHAPNEFRLGQLVRALERGGPLIDCAEPPCVLRGQCALRGLLQEAEEAFYAALDQHTLADTLTGPTQVVLLRLHGPR